MSAVTPYNPTNIALFLPNKIGGLSLWLDAADSSTVITSGANVTAWNDKSGSKNNAVGAANGITLDSANNRLVFPVTGTPYLTNTTMAFPLSTRTIFIVAQETSNAQYSGILCWIPNPNSGSDYTTTNGMSIETTNGMRFYENSAGYQSDLNTITPTNPFPKAIYCDRLETRAGSGFVNGKNTTNITATFTPGTSVGFVVGGRWPLGSSGYFKGYMYEILAFNTALSTTQRQQVESYLAYKWNLQASLPTTHPYYGTPYNAYGSFTNINQIVKYAYPMLPNDIAGLSLWLDAADSASVIVSPGTQNVTAWNDKSGNGRNATTAGSPSYIPSSLNGMNGVRLSGTTQSWATPSFVLSPTSRVSAFVVANGTRNVNSQVNLLMSGTTFLNLSVYLAYNVAISPPYAIFIGGQGTNLSTTFTNTQNVPNIYEVVYNSTTASSFVNGNSCGTFSAAVSGTSLTSSQTLVSTHNGNNTVIEYEFLFFNTALSVNQRQAVEGYLAWKWGLQASLPSTHPYFNNAFVPYMTQPVPTTITMYQYSPKSLSGLSLWLDAADSASVVTSGSSVTQWNDKSGNANNTTAQNTGTFGFPRISSTQLNGLNLINIPGGLISTGGVTSTYFRTNSAVSFPTTNHTIFFIYRVTSSVASLNINAADYLYFNPVYSATGNFRHGFIRQRVATNATWTLSDYTSGLAGQPFGYSSGVPIANEVLFFASSGTSTTPSSYTVTKNGSNQTITAGTSMSYPTSEVLYLFEQDGFSSVTNTTFSQDVAELIIFNSILSTTNRQAVEGYLAYKWGLQANLPSNHPYKLYPP